MVATLPLIAPATRERLRLLDERAMPSRCRVLRRPATVVDGRATYGAETEIASVACRLVATEQSPQEGEAVGRLGETTFGQINVPLGTAVLDRDRIEVTTDGVVVGYFEAVGDAWPPSYATSLPVAVQRED